MPINDKAQAHQAETNQPYAPTIHFTALTSQCYILLYILYRSVIFYIDHLLNYYSF